MVWSGLRNSASEMGYNQYPSSQLAQLNLSRKLQSDDGRP